MKKFFTKNVKIGLTVILALAFLIWGIEFLKGVNLFKPANYYYATFDNVDGLVDAAPVTVSGFQVGQVKEIGYDYKHNRITVMVSMNKDLRIPASSSMIMATSLLGTSQLVLELGSGSPLNVGDTIEGIQMQGLMSSVTDEVMPSVKGLMPKVDSIMGNVNDIVADPSLHMTVGRLDAISMELERSAASLTALLKQLNGAVPQLMNNVNGVVGNVNGLTSGLNGSINNLNTFTTSLSKVQIDETVKQLDATLANLKQLTSNLNNPNSSLGKLMNDKELYDNANHAIASLDTLLNDLKANPKRYVNIKVF